MNRNKSSNNFLGKIYFKDILAKRYKSIKIKKSLTRLNLNTQRSSGANQCNMQQNLIQIFTFPHCLHFPFSVLRCIQWWWVVVCSRYWRTPTSRKVGLHASVDLSIRSDIQLEWALILHAEHFIRDPCR